MRYFPVVLAFFLLAQMSECCNEAVCASIVSKCMITQSCKCDLKNCSCIKECFSCLSHLYSECCSCVDLCPKPNHTFSALSSKSHVEDLPQAVPNLFQVLTSEADAHQRWTTFNFPVDIETSPYHPRLDKTIKYRTIILENVEEEVDPTKDMMITLNCSVAYISQCLPWNKCKGSCQSMGAVSYRWFHNGCCECIGENCINYGINECRCLKCPEPEEALFHFSDYGEEE